MTSVITPSNGQPINDVNRLAALHASGLLDAAPEETFDRFTRLASRLLSCPVSTVTLVDDRRQFFLSAAGVPPPWSERRETPLEYSFCQHVVTGGATLCVTDARRDARVSSNLAIDALGVIAYLGVPIRSEDGYVLGSFCAIDSRARDWSPADLESLQELGCALAAEVRLRDRTRALTDVLREQEASEREREQMMRLLVHDLRSPVAAIASTLEIIQSEPAKVEENAELIGLVREGAEEILGMLNQMLELHRMKAGRLILEPRVFSVGALLREILQQMRALVAERGQSLAVQYPENAVEFSADRTLLKRVLVNLVSNAAKYAGPGARVEIGGEADENEVRLWVEDDGPGIPAGMRESIFSAFERGVRGGEGRDASFGLGLSFCRLAVEAHDGTIAALPGTSGGSRFELRVPRRSANGAA